LGDTSVGRLIADIDGVKYYTDRAVVEDGPSIAVRVGYVEFSATYNVFTKSWNEKSGLNFQMPGGISLGVNDQGEVQLGTGYGLGQVAVVKKPDGEYVVVVGVGVDAGLIGGISISGELSGSAYQNNLSTYNSVQFNADGTSQKTLTQSGPAFWGQSKSRTLDYSTISYPRRPRRLFVAGFPRLRVI
jgi:hypothetical protein